MKAECGKCHKVVLYYQVRKIRIMVKPDKVYADMDIVCPSCAERMGTNVSNHYSPEEILTRAKAQTVLLAPVIKEKNEDGSIRS